MNSHWNNNKSLLQQRFPALFELLKVQLEETEKTLDFEKNLFPFWQIEKAKNGSVTIREDSVLLHSGYNPDREAQQGAIAQDNQQFEAAVFFGFGAGYLPNAFCDNHREKTVILVEPDAMHFIAALTLLDWSKVFTHEKCILASGCDFQTLLGIINHIGIKNCVFFEQKNQTRHAQQYFNGFHSLLERNRRKDEINSRTLEKFAGLWLRNSMYNLPNFALLDGIKIYRNKAQNLDGVVLAAGPSLNQILPYLSEIKKRAVVICVDTALRACLKAKVEPDFIILADPQYWAARHLEGLQSPSSVLITESAAYPSVFRFKCRKIVMCSSLFPLGQYFEKQLGEKGKIEAGGSVSTSAWDFARFIGSRNIYTAGLDLSYPGKNTHIKGSTFEEAAHKISFRLLPVQTQSTKTLYSIQSEEGRDYNGNPVITDPKMKMFAWWFESKLASPDSVPTFTFCSQSLAIPGIKVANLSDFLSLPEKITEKKEFFQASEKDCLEFNSNKREEQRLCFEQAKKYLAETLQALYEKAQKGVYLCDKALENSSSIESCFKKLNEIDDFIRSSNGKEIISLVFPTENQLKIIFEKENFSQDKMKANLQRSRLIYKELVKAIKEYFKFLP